MIRRPLIALVAVLAAAGAGAAVFSVNAGYSATMVLPEASNLVEHTSVQIAGANAGTVDHISTEDGHALVRVTIDPAYAPLHDGTTARIRWKAVLGQRVLEVLPGPPNGPALPDGALIVGVLAPVEFDDVLAAFDQPTRQRLTSLIGQLDTTLDDRQAQFNTTIRTAGPAVDALGRVLGGIGADTPAITAVVSRLNQLTGTAARRQTDVSGIVEKLASTATEVATRRAQIRETLQELPSTLTEIESTLNKVPAATDATVPLLNKLAPGTAKLPAVAKNLGPLLEDLRPAAADLRPTLEAAQDLFDSTPDLLDRAHDVLPPALDSIRSSQDAMAFLRPYTPELAGFFVNWGSFAAPVDGNGHYTRVLAPQGPTSFTNNPGVLPPGITRDRAPLPGAQEGQPWQDATGSGMR